MGSADYYEAGQWNVNCAECGKKLKSSKVLKNWKGLYVCSRCWDPRHPQDFVRNVSAEQPPTFVQKLEFTPIGAAGCTPESMTAIADIGKASCALCEYVGVY